MSLGLNELIYWIVWNIVKDVFHFVSYLQFSSTEEDQVYNGATLHVAYPILSMPFLLMTWWPEEPGHQQERYWPSKPEYSVFSIRRVKMWGKCKWSYFPVRVIHGNVVILQAAVWINWLVWGLAWSLRRQNWKNSSAWSTPLARRSRSPPR